MNILVAEYNQINAIILLNFLGKLDVTSVHVENRKHAVEAVERGDYDLILMDIQMPVMDGTEVTKIIRQSHDKNCLPIIAFTANVLKNDVEQYIQIVINDHIEPF